MITRIRDAIEREVLSKIRSEEVMKKSKHHNLCELVKERFENKGIGKDYRVVREEEEYGMQKVNYNGQPIKGECDDYALHIGKNNKRYLYVIEVKSSNTKKGRSKALLQLAKDSVHYKQLYKADRVLAFYAYGDRKDKKGLRVTYKYVSQSRLERIIIK